MNIHSAFPAGSLLKAADLKDRQVRVTIEDVEIQEIGGESKPVVTFEGKDAGLALNKTNARSIAEAYGDETDNWRGRPIVLVPSVTEFQGRSVACIRVRVERAAMADDGIPF